MPTGNYRHSGVHLFTCCSRAARVGGIHSKNLPFLAILMRVNANAKVEQVEVQQSLDNISEMYITVLYL